MIFDDHQLQSSVRDEVTHWFFEDYLRTWIGVGAGTITRGPEFILDYWSAPLYWSDDQGSCWFLDGQAVVAQQHELQTRLRAVHHLERGFNGCAPRATRTPRCPTTE